MSAIPPVPRPVPALPGLCPRSWIPSPTNGQTITSGSVQLSAEVSGGTGGISEVDFSAKYGGQWHGLRTITAPPYAYNWNMCSAGVPDGDVEVGLEVKDKSGGDWVYSQHQANYHITKSGCPAPPTVSVASVWTTDWNNTSKSTFSTGDQIEYQESTYNTTGNAQNANFVWSVNGPCGSIFSQSHTNNTPTGTYDWWWKTTIPGSACGGTYTFQLSVTYGGNTTTKSTNFTVVAAPPPSTPSNPSPADNKIIAGTNDTTFTWTTNGSSCDLTHWGGRDTNPVTNYGGNCSSYDIGTVPPGLISWQVTAHNNNGGATQGPVWHLKVQPAEPTELSAVAASQTQIALSWYKSDDDFPGGNVDNYNVYQNGAVIATLLAGSTSYQADGLTCGQTYSFYVTAVRQQVESAAPSPVTVASRAAPYPAHPPIPVHTTARRLAAKTIRRSHGAPPVRPATCISGAVHR